VKSTTLGWWSSEFARRDREEAGRSEESPRVVPTTFLPVRVIGGGASGPVTADVSSGARVELMLGSGRVLRVPVGVDVAWVGRVVAALEESSQC
jgi:hypothetical protein